MLFIRSNQDDILLDQLHFSLCVSNYTWPREHKDLMFPNMGMLRGGTLWLYLKDAHNEIRCYLLNTCNNAHSYP